MVDQVDNVTPELGLVDPILAALARARLPEPRDCLAVERRRPAAMRTSTVGHRLEADVRQPPVARPPTAPGSSGLVRLAVVSAWLLASAVIGSSLLAFIPPRGLSRPRLLTVGDAVRLSHRPIVGQQSATVSQARETLGGESGRGVAVARPDGGISIRWPSARRAAFYNVVVFRDANRVDLWPTGDSVTYVVPRTLWIARGLKGIRYRWFVYPGQRTGRVVKFGRLLAHGVLVARSSSEP